MSRLGELMALFLQETEETERNRGTLIDLLKVRTMDGGDRLRRRKSLQQRLGLKSIVCCGSTWGFGASAMNTQAQYDEEDEQNDVVESIHQQIHQEIHQQNDVVESIHQQLIHQELQEQNDVVEDGDRECSTFPSPRMNLADALAAERHFRSTAVSGGGGDIQENEMTANDAVTGGSTTGAGTPLRVSLMRLLEETDGQDEGNGKEEGVGRDQVCCVCMGRKKGAAFIPCGHTFCRVCCRELWLNRGCCALCNRSIVEILDIY